MESIPEVITLMTSGIGIYQVIYWLWTWAEKMELGHAVVTKADTFIAYILTVIITLVLTIARWASYHVNGNLQKEQDEIEK